MLVVWRNQVDSLVSVWLMSKIEQVKKETCLQIRKRRITWQPIVEMRWLATLLENEKAVVPLPKFLKTMRI